MTDTGETMGLREAVARVIEPKAARIAFEWHQTEWGPKVLANALAKADAILALPQLAAQQARIAELERALNVMIDEQCDYMRINKLGDPEQKHSVRTARAALRKDPQQ